MESFDTLPKDTILATLTNGNTTESLIERVFYEKRNNQVYRVIKTIKRIVTTTTAPAPAHVAPVPARNIKPFGAAAKAGVDNMLFTSYGEEVTITTPASANTPLPSAPIAKISLNEFIKNSEKNSTIIPENKTHATFASKAMDLHSSTSTPENEHTRTIFLDNIPSDAIKETIATFICTTGKVDHTTIKRINIVFDKETRKSQCKAFVVFNTATIALKVQAAVDGERFEYNIVNAQIAKPRKD